MSEDVKARIESELDIKSYLQNLKYAIQNGAKIEFQVQLAEKAFTSEMFPYKK